MTKIHYFQRYSSVENTVTNNTLQLFTQIYGYSIQQVSKLLSDLTEVPIEIGIEINQQTHMPKSVPDGVILQRSFKVIIESKVDSPVNVEQLSNHAKSFSDESQKILLLLTKHHIDEKLIKDIQSSINRIQPTAIFKNITYEEICNQLAVLFKDYEYEMKSLVEDYIAYCNDSDLTDESKYLMRVVPCGQSLDINNKYGIYFQPSDRGYTKHTYIGIYAQKEVHTIWKVDSVFDVTYKNNSLTKDLIQGRDTSDYDHKIMQMIMDAKKDYHWDIAQNHRFFCGQKVEKTNFIKTSFGGIQAARFINLKEMIGEFKDAAEVAVKLDGKQWK